MLIVEHWKMLKSSTKALTVAFNAFHAYSFEFMQIDDVINNEIS